MTATELVRRIQALVNENHNLDPKLAEDGIPGIRTQAALDDVFSDALAERKALVTRLPNGAIITKPGWKFSTIIDGEDLVMRNVYVTAFGGTNDVMDSGETASGLSTAKNPNFMGAALPMRRDASRHLRNSPVPKVPWRTKVIFSDPMTGTVAETELIDEGPANWTGNGADMTIAAARMFQRRATANNFKMKLNVRIVGGAKYA